jgi:hypothetical protein
MQLLNELLRVKRINDEEDDQRPEESNQDEDFDLEGEEPHDDEQSPDFGDNAEDGMGPDTPDDLGQEDPKLNFSGNPQDPSQDDGNVEGEDTEQENVDPNRAGVIRNVKGAHLIYKREIEDGSYEEMWIFNSGEFKKDIEIKKAIIAGTDIPSHSTRSPDGSQELKMWSAGNADIMVLTGLAN